MDAGRILIVDDNLDAAEMLQLLLRLDGHEVAIAQSGEEALSKVAQFIPQIILSDIRMSGIDGLDLAKKIRSSLNSTNAFLVAITGLNDSASLKAVKDAGYNMHFLKPVSYDELSKNIQAYLCEQKVAS